MNYDTVNIIFDFIDEYDKIKMREVCKLFRDVLVNDKKFNDVLKCAKNMSKDEICCDINSIFREEVTKSNINAIKWLYRNWAAQINFADDYLIIAIFTKKNWDIAKWILSLKISIDITVRDNRIFKNACCEGNLEFAKYVKSIGSFTSHGFWEACIMGHLEIIQWLYEILGKNELGNSLTPFEHVCIYGHTEIAKWLFLRDPPSEFHIESAFAIACACNRLDTVKWIYNQCNISDDILYKILYRNVPFETKLWICNTLKKDSNMSQKILFE